MLPKTPIVKLAILAAIPIILTSSVAGAQTLIKHGESGNMIMLPLTSCAAPAANRTFELPDRTPKGFGLLLLHFETSTVANVTLQCFSSINRDFRSPETHGSLQICDTVTGGVCTLADSTWSKTTTGPQEFIIRVDVLGSEDIQCITTCSAGNIRVWGRMSAL